MPTIELLESAFGFCEEKPRPSTQIVETLRQGNLENPFKLFAFLDCEKGTFFYHNSQSMYINEFIILAKKEGFTPKTHLCMVIISPENSKDAMKVAFPYKHYNPEFYNAIDGYDPSSQVAQKSLHKKYQRTWHSQIRDTIMEVYKNLNGLAQLPQQSYDEVQGPEFKNMEESPSTRAATVTTTVTATTAPATTTVRTTTTSVMSPQASQGLRNNGIMPSTASTSSTASSSTAAPSSTDWLKGFKVFE